VVEEPSDEELCRKVAARDARAFEMLVQRHQARAYRIAFSIIGNEADARDVSQDAFIRVYESAHRFDERSRFSTWFYRIVVNLCIDQHRRNRWWRRLAPLSGSADDPESLAAGPPSPEPGPEIETARRRAVDRLRTALAGLSAKQRAAILLVQQGLSSREIGAVLKCSENTARVHVHRAVSELRKALKED
jgi:RNA polymerase sigma-70 factor, ECF subfamily